MGCINCYKYWHNICNCVRKVNALLHTIQSMSAASTLCRKADREPYGPWEHLIRFRDWFPRLNLIIYKYGRTSLRTYCSWYSLLVDWPALLLVWHFTCLGAICPRKIYPVMCYVEGCLTRENQWMWRRDEGYWWSGIRWHSPPCIELPTRRQ